MDNNKKRLKTNLKGFTMNYIIKMKKLFFFYCFISILFYHICYGEEITLNKVTVKGEEKLIVDSQTEELYFFKESCSFKSK